MKRSVSLKDQGTLSKGPFLEPQGLTAVVSGPKTAVVSVKIEAAYVYRGPQITSGLYRGR